MTWTSLPLKLHFIRDIKKMKREAVEWEKIFTINISHERVIWDI